MSTKLHASSASSPLHHRIIQTADVEQARQVLSALDAATAMEPAHGVPFKFTSRIVSCDEVHLVRYGLTGGGQVVVPEVERYILSLPVTGAFGGKYAGADFVVESGRGGMLFSPARGGVVCVGAGSQVRSINIERVALERHLTLLTGAAPHGPLWFEAIVDFERGPGKVIAGLARLLRREVVQKVSSWLLITSLRDALLTALISGLSHSASRLLAAPTRRVAPACVRRAEEYMTAHAAETITLEDVVTVVGVSARSLQASFQKYRGTTPMAFLKQRRMELARQQLLGASGGLTVASVARELGFGNPGRFAVEYRQCFGESPSQTLGRACEAERRR